MTQDLVSSAPSVYAEMLTLITAAGAAQSTPVQVFPAEILQYEPGSYVIVGTIENHVWDPETIGSFSQLEHYDVTGIATVYTGDSPGPQNPSVVTTVMSDTYTLFQGVVMTTMMSNRTMPILGASPSPFQMLPGYARYSHGVGSTAAGPTGWYGQLEWSFHFDAYITPA